MRKVVNFSVCLTLFLKIFLLRRGGVRTKQNVGYFTGPVGSNPGDKFTDQKRVLAICLGHFTAPRNAIIPIPVSIADSSILKVGVCTLLLIPFDLLPAPSLKKQPGILCE